MTGVGPESPVPEPVAQAVAALDGIEFRLLQQVNLFTGLVRTQYALTGLNPLSPSVAEAEATKVSQGELFEDIGMMHPLPDIAKTAAADASVARLNAIEAQEILDAACPRPPLPPSEQLPPERRTELKQRR